MNLAKLSLVQLIARMESAPDFGYDDEEAEMQKRGIKYRWNESDKIVIC